MKSYDLDPEKCKALAAKLSDQILKAHDGWNDPAKLQAAKDRCKAENEARKERLKR
jgi:hypothetical protein